MFLEGGGGFGEFGGVCAGASWGVFDWVAAACGRGVSLAWAKTGGGVALVSCWGIDERRVEG